jgi:hypothetical protein
MNQKDKCKTEEEPRPEFVTDEHLRFLDALRESGQTNMFGAAPYIADLFEIPMQQARIILTYWMQTFGNRKRNSQNPNDKENSHER